MKKMFVTILIAVSLLILVAGAVFASAKMKEKKVEFHGTFHGEENNALNLPFLYVHGNGSGNATELGQFTSHMEGIVYNDENGVGIGVEGVNITAANGDVLFATGTGIGVSTKDPAVNKIVEKYTITGGTGRYLKASGNFTLERLLTLATQVSSGTIEGTIELH